MPKASELSPDFRYVALFVGRSGTGKTPAACSFPGNTYVMDFDGRIRGLLGTPWVDRTNIAYDYFPPKEKGLVDRINNKLDVMMTQATTGTLDIQTLVLDSLTSECLAMIQQAIPLTHNTGATKGEKRTGKYLGTIAMAGPEDYGFEAQATYDIIAFLKSLPIKNIIVTAHTVGRYQKSDPDNPFSPSIQIGEQLSVRDKIGENIQIHFDHIVKFEKYESAGAMRFVCKFWSDLARSSYSNLPHGEVDITGKSFHEVLMSYVKQTEATAEESAQNQQ